MCMYHYVYSNTGMYIHVYTIHEPCVQQGRPGGVAIYNVYVHVEWRGFESHLRRIFSRKSEPWVCCVALPCLFVCLCLLLSFFLLSSLIKTCIGIQCM